MQHAASKSTLSIPRRILALSGAVLSSLVIVGFAIAAAVTHEGLIAALGLLGLTCVVGFVILSRRDAQAVLTLLLILLFLVPQDYVLVGPLRGVGNPAQLVALLALVLWCAARLLGLIKAEENHPVRWVLLLYAFAGISSFAAGMSRTLPLAESAGAIRAIFPFMATLGIALLAVDGLNDRERVDALLQRLVWLGGVAAFVGILEFAFKGFRYHDAMHLPGLTTTTEVLVSDTRWTFDRIRGGAAHPIEYAVTLAALAPLALHYVLHGKSKRRRQLSTLTLLFILIVIPMTISRSGIVGLAVGLGIYAMHLSLRGRLNAVVVGLIGLGFYGAAIPGLLGTLKGLFLAGEQDPSIAARTEDYAKIPGLMHGYEIFGRGLGTFQPLAYFYLDNQYLGSLLEGGIVALLALLACSVIGIGVSRGIRHRTAEPALRGMGQALAGSIAALALCAGTFDELSFRQCTYTFFLVLGCAGALWSAMRTNPKRRWSGDLRDSPELTQAAVE
jgi:hypothetical protein